MVHDTCVKARRGVSGKYFWRGGNFYIGYSWHWEIWRTTLLSFLMNEKWIPHLSHPVLPPNLLWSLLCGDGVPIIRSASMTCLNQVDFTHLVILLVFHQQKVINQGVPAPHPTQPPPSPQQKEIMLRGNECQSIPINYGILGHTTNVRMAT